MGIFNQGGARDSRLVRGLCYGAILLAVGGCCPDGDGEAFSEGSQVLLSVTPNPISFGLVSVGSELTISVAISNQASATGTAVIESIRLENASDEITITQPERLVLAPGEGTTMTVRYAPTDAVFDSGQLVITYNNPDAMVVQIETPSQSGSLIFYPQIIGLGQVLGGTPSVFPVEGRNVGSSELAVGPTTISSLSPDLKTAGPYLPSAEGGCPGFVEGTTERLEQPFTLAAG
ncbi:MAG: hypothetical protein ACI9OJ_001332, partial [Myxococcota bacterium]